MRRLFARSRSLLLVVVLALVAALCTVSTSNAASSASAAPHKSAASSAQCNFVLTLGTCESTDHTVAYYDTPTGDTSHCTFVFNITWGDGGSATRTLTDPTAGHHLIAEHTYAAPGVYTITVTPQVTAGTCTATSSGHTFTLLPAPPPTPKPVTDFPWAGYGLFPDSGHVTSVTATWRVPTVNCTKDSKARTAVWVGMWGTVKNSWLPQIGTDSDCGYRGTYLAVFQIPHSPDAGWLTTLSGIIYLGENGPSPILLFTIHAGDRISASVTYDGSVLGFKKFKIWIKNQSTGQEWSHEIATLTPASLDEVAGGGGAIVEDKDGVGLAEFNPGKGHHRLDITGLHVTFDKNPARWTARPYRIALNGHYLTGSVSKLTSDGNFSVTWKAAK
jgi:Peptidase A4 family